MRYKWLHIVSIIVRIISPILAGLLSGTILIKSGVNYTISIAGILILLALFLTMKDELLRLTKPISTIGLGIAILVIITIFKDLFWISIGLIAGGIIGLILDSIYDTINKPVSPNTVLGEIATQLKILTEKVTDGDDDGEDDNIKT